MAKETFYQSMKTIKEDFERSIILMEVDFIYNLDYNDLVKNKEIVRDVYEDI